MRSSKERLLAAQARGTIGYIPSMLEVQNRSHFDRELIASREAVAIAEKQGDSRGAFFAHENLNKILRIHGYLPLDEEDAIARFEAVTSGKKYLAAYTYYADLRDPQRQSNTSRVIASYRGAAA